MISFSFREITLERWTGERREQAGRKGTCVWSRGEKMRPDRSTWQWG